MTETTPRRAGNRPGPKPRFDRDAVIDAAIAIADRPLSLARVAAALGMAPASLYRYIDGLDELAVAAAHRLFVSSPLSSTDHGWRRFLLDEAELRWTLLLDHPGVVVGREEALTPVVATRFEAVVRALVDLGFTVRDATLASDTVLGVVHNAAVQVRWSADAEHPSGLSDAARDHLTAYSEDVAAEVREVMTDPRAYMLAKVDLVLAGLADLAPRP